MALDLGAWSAGSWAAAAAWATVALYVVLAIYAIKQVGEARRLREAQLRPYVVVDFAVNWLTNLYIENIGQTVARDIRLSFDPPLASTMERPWAWEESMLFSDGIPTLPPRKRIDVFFDSMISRYESDLPLRYTATVTYTGVGNRDYTDDYVLDLGMYRGTPPPPDAMPELVKAVEKLSKEVEKWTERRRVASQR